MYTVSNATCQDINIKIRNAEGIEIEDILAQGEVVYGVSQQAVDLLSFYELLGVVKIELSDGKEPRKSHWLTEGF
jgi:hypothetical protein